MTPAASGGGPPGPLEGLCVLDVATLFSAPLLAAMLGDLGADVIKIEHPRGDALRQLGGKAGDKSLTWIAVGRNKRAITLDLGRPEGQAVFRRLVERADVLVENLPPRTLARWKCSYEDLAALNPRLVVVSVSCYGRTGPYRERAGNGTLAEAFGGLANMNGEADGPPLLTSLGLGDVLAAVSGVVGSLAACYHRDARGGGGQHVDVSMYEPILQLLGTGPTEFDRSGRAPRPRATPLPGAVPRTVYRTADGAWVAVSAVTDRLVERLLPLLGLDAPEDTRRFGSVDARREHGDALDRALARWIEARDRESALETLLAAGIPVAPVNDLAAIFADPQVRARANFVELVDEEAGPVKLLAPTPRLGATPGGVRRTGPALGAHNDEVYRDWLGMSADELATLRRDGVI